MEWLLWIETLLPEFPARRALILGTFVLTPILLSLRVATQLFRPVTGSQRLTKSSLRGQAWSLSNNLALAFINQFVWVALLGGVYLAFSTADTQSWFWRQPPADETWMAGWSTLSQCLLILVFIDFEGYWSHRLLHSRLGWLAHALHHTDRHLNFATSFRIHFLEGIFRTLCTVTILGWLNLPEVPVIMAGIFSMWYGFYLHSELPWRHGVLKRVFSSPDYHRWHHADVPEAYGKNLSIMFPVFDIVFGTYYDPGPCRAEIGVSDIRDDIISGQAYPFIQAGKWFRAQFNNLRLFRRVQ